MNHAAAQPVREPMAALEGAETDAPGGGPRPAPDRGAPQYAPASESRRRGMGLVFLGLPLLAGGAAVFHALDAERTSSAAARSRRGVASTGGSEGAATPAVRDAGKAPVGGEAVRGSPSDAARPPDSARPPSASAAVRERLTAKDVDRLL